MPNGNTYFAGAARSVSAGLSTGAHADSRQRAGDSRSPSSASRRRAVIMTRSR